LSFMSISAGKRKRQPPPALSAALFVGVIVAISLGIGYVTRPGEWYAALAKPAFNPPSWVFGPVWTSLYIVIASAGWRIWHIAPRSAAMMLWVGQMVLNWLWSPTFFGAEAPWLALAIIVAMLGCILMVMVQTWRFDRVTTWLFAPYAAWVAFATVLNGSIAVMN